MRLFVMDRGRIRSVLRRIVRGVTAVMQLFGFVTFAGTETEQGARRKEDGKPTKLGSHAGDITRPAGKGARGKRAFGGGVGMGPLAVKRNRVSA